MKKLNSKKRIRFRIWVWFSIALFLLIPLLSGQVGATFTYYCEGKADNKTTGPSAQAICPEPWTFEHDDGDTPLAIFCCNITFLDSNPNGNGSNQRVRLTITPPGPPTGQNDTTWIFLSPSQGPIYTKRYVNLTYNPPTSWEVKVEAWCWDIDLGPTQTAYAVETVIVEIT